MGEAHNVRVIGLGKQKIVLGHGFGTDQSVWNWSTLCLISLMNTVSSSMIIWGRVLQTLIFFYFERYSTLEGFAYDLLAILEELQVDSCIFVGHSVSGMIGLIASAVMRPDLFSKIVILSPTPWYVLTS